MTKHEAIFKLYPFVSLIRGNDAFDVNGNIVHYDLTAVQSEIDANVYKVKRAAAYPSIVDQLDLLYHGGLDAWKASIKAVKDQYPKGE